jgi:phosphoribosylformylglycinamidine cyclo-ligase
MDKMNYKTSGVNVVAGEEAVQAIKSAVRATYNKNVLSELGSFGGLYQIDLETWKKPVLVSSTDGVGTKIRVAIQAGILNTIGQDLVNHCVNDILVQGAIPQYFLDYIGVGLLNPKHIEQIIEGLVTACKANGCALIGGEMAEMSGIYQPGDFDLVGTIVGLVEKDKLLPSANLKPGDKLIGLPSSGLHTNGYSLARKIVFEKLQLNVDSYVPECDATVAELLLSVHRSYLRELQPLLGSDLLHGLAHITGGGIPGNLKRIIPDGMLGIVDSKSWEVPALFQWLQKAGVIHSEDMLEAFNMGIGMILVVDPALDWSSVLNPGAVEIGVVETIGSSQTKVKIM